MLPGMRRAFLVPTRPLAVVPRSVLLALALALAAQLGWHALAPAPSWRAQSLPTPPDVSVLRLAAFGEPTVLAVGGVLWLQFFDEQPGYSIPYRELDYDRLRGWLERWLALSPQSDYPLLMAVRLYGQVADPARQRIMLEFAHDAFLQQPHSRWRWVAEAAIIAEHRLEDRQLALRYARALAENTRAGEVPHWARDLQILLLEDMGALETARILIGGLLAAGEIEDPREIRFLERRLEALERRIEQGSGR